MVRRVFLRYDLRMPRAIIHVDLDAFYCAVEELRTPALCGPPFAVGGRPEGRGVYVMRNMRARILPGPYRCVRKLHGWHFLGATSTRR